VIEMKFFLQDGTEVQDGDERWVYAVERETDENGDLLRWRKLVPLAVVSEFNPHHDARGRFTTSSGTGKADSFAPSVGGSVRVVGSARREIKDAAAEYMSGLSWELSGLKDVSLHAEPGGTFMLNGQSVTEGGEWSSGRISMYNINNSVSVPDALEAFSHEVGHNAYKVIENEAMSGENAHVNVAYHDFIRAYMDPGGDGVTEYSRAWYKNKVPSETFAEMFRLDTRHGRMALEEIVLEGGSGARRQLLDSYDKMSEAMGDKYGGSEHE